MFGIGFQEMLVIIFLALVLIGPKKLPELAKAIGRTIAELKRAVDDVKETIDEEIFKEEKRIIKDGYDEVKGTVDKVIKDEYNELKETANIDSEASIGNG